MDPDLGVVPDPRWIPIHVIPILAPLDVIPDPDQDPAKNGIVTPLIWASPRALPFWDFGRDLGRSRPNSQTAYSTAHIDLTRNC